MSITTATDIISSGTPVDVPNEMNTYLTEFLSYYTKNYATKRREKIKTKDYTDYFHLHHTLARPPGINRDIQ